MNITYSYVLLVRLYDGQSRTVDYLPYTDEFEWIYSEFIKRTGLDWDRHRVMLALTRLRKQRLLTVKFKGVYTQYIESLGPNRTPGSEPGYRGPIRVATTG